MGDEKPHCTHTFNSNCTMFDEKRLYLQSVPSLDSWHKDQTNLTSFSRNPQIHHKEPRYGSKKHRSNLSSWLLFPFGRYRVIAQGKWGVVGGYEDRWKSSYLLSSHLVLVGPVSAIGCAAVVKAMIENKERKIDSLTDDLAAGLNIQYTEECVRLFWGLFSFSYEVQTSVQPAGSLPC